MLHDALMSVCLLYGSTLLVRREHKSRNQEMEIQGIHLLLVLITDLKYVLSIPTVLISVGLDSHSDSHSGHNSARCYSQSVITP